MGVACRDGEGGVVDLQSIEPGDEVVGIEAGGIDADEEVNAAVLVHQVGEALPKLGVADGGLDDFQFRRGGLELGVEEGGVMAVA